MIFVHGRLVLPMEFMEDRVKANANGSSRKRGDLDVVSGRLLSDLILEHLILSLSPGYTRSPQPTMLATALILALA